MDKLERAVVHLLTRSENEGGGAFYAFLLLQMRRVVDKNLPEHSLAGVTVQNGRILFLYDPDRLEALTMEQVVYIIEHECMHLILEHLIRRGERHPLAWNIAADLSVNSYLSKEHCIGIYPGVAPFKDMPPGKAADWYYDKMPKHEVSVTDNGDGTLTIEDKKTGKKFKVSLKGDHDKWNNVDEEGSGVTELDKEIIRQAVQEAYNENQKQRGRLPSGLEEKIQELLKPPTVNWKRLLRSFIATSVKSGSRYTWMRESRRFGLDTKGREKIRHLNMIVAIDTSGSISENEFVEFINEIKGIQKAHKGKTTVIECDADVQKVYHLRIGKQLDTQFKGRGGTSFKPVFDYLRNKKEKPDVFVYFTDLYGDQDSLTKPNYPCVWVRTSNSDVNKIPFGRLISIARKDRS